MATLRVWTERVLVGGLAPVVVFGSRFAGNIILSRLLSPEEFGTAVAISTVIGLGGLATDVALDRFVMIDGTPRSLSTAHVLAIVNSALLATVLFVVSPAVAGLFGVAKFAGSFAFAAALVVVGGFPHLGVKQIQRDYKYGPDAIAQVVSNLAGLAALFWAAVEYHNHRAIIFSLGVQLVVNVILSQIFASTSYRLSYDKVTLRQALAFGLPLTLNGIGLAIASQLDRVLVGYWFGVKELSVYAVIFSMSVVPTNLIVGVFSGLSFSFLLSGVSESSDRSERYRLILGFYSSVTSLYALWMAVTLDLLIPLIFGPAFTISAPEHVLFILIACFRLQRSGAPTALLLASGRTKQLALLNLSSGFGLMIAFALITVWPRFESMLVGIAIGELISCTIFFMSLKSVMHRRPMLGDLASAVATPAIIAAVLAYMPEFTWESRGTVFVIGLVAVGAQLGFEIYKNKKFRSILVSFPRRSPIGG